MTSPQFDTYLRLEDAKKKVLAENDDIDAKNLNSRLIFTPKEDGVYRIIATSFGQRGVGAYTLVIREFKGDPKQLSPKPKPPSDPKQLDPKAKPSELVLKDGSAKVQAELSTNDLRTLCDQDPISRPAIAARVGSSDRVMPSDASIEARITQEFGEDSYAHADELTVPERTILAGVLRLAVNAMLLLTEFGHKRLGPANESHYRHLQHFVQVAQKRRQGVSAAQRNLRLAAQLYGFSQNVVLHEEEERTTTTGPRGESESPRRPEPAQAHLHQAGPG